MVQKEKKYITWEGLNQHAKNVGKKIKECDTGVIGGYNGSFPLTAATKGNIYLLPATKKYYVCIKNYNGSQLTAPNANFEELSVYTNRSKLDNLIRINSDINTNILIKTGIFNSKVASGEENTIFFETPFPYKCIAVLVVDSGTSGVAITSWKIHATPTRTSFRAYYTNVQGNARSPYLTYLAIGY